MFGLIGWHPLIVPLISLKPFIFSPQLFRNIFLCADDQFYFFLKKAFYKWLCWQIIHLIICSFLLFTKFSISLPLMRYNALLQFPVHYKNTSYWSSSSSSSTSSINILYFQVTSLCHRSVLKSPRLDRTMLTRYWFQMNIDDPSTHDLYYSQFPDRCVWDVNRKPWSGRKKRLQFHLAAGPGASYIFLECFWTVLKGQQGLKTLYRKVSGIVDYASFQHTIIKAIGLMLLNGLMLFMKPLRLLQLFMAHNNQSNKIRWNSLMTN